MDNQTISHAYILKRGEPTSFDHAVPLDSCSPPPQRLLCSGRTITKIEIIFPIRLTTPLPHANILNGQKQKISPIVFVAEQSNPSRAVFIAETEIFLDGKYLEFHISRDCAVLFYLDDEK
jgi:hypothetical protein